MKVKLNMVIKRIKIYFYMFFIMSFLSTTRIMLTVSVPDTKLESTQRILIVIWRKKIYGELKSGQELHYFKFRTDLYKSDI